jgi:hypothetical protein
MYDKIQCSPTYRMLLNSRNVLAFDTLGPQSKARAASIAVGRVPDTRGRV